MLSGDAAKLDRLLDDRLRHVYSSGHVDDKASWMSNFGRLWQYRPQAACRRHPGKLAPASQFAQ
jgi:hypothetical protein